MEGEEEMASARSIRRYRERLILQETFHIKQEGVDILVTDDGKALAQGPSGEYDQPFGNASDIVAVLERGESLLMPEGKVQVKRDPLRLGGVSYRYNPKTKRLEK